MRLVRVLMGQDAVADTKVAWVRDLTALGLHIQLTEKGIRTYPEQAKASKWIQCIKRSWLQGNWRRVLRARSRGGSRGEGPTCSQDWDVALPPLYDQRSRPDGNMSAGLREALVWWLRVLRSDAAQLKMFSTPVWHVVHLTWAASYSKEARPA